MKQCSECGSTRVVKGHCTNCGHSVMDTKVIKAVIIILFFVAAAAIQNDWIVL